ncbi:ABC transporter permease [Fictibacillus aquaticus]|uniref:ABC transporter permease n=1 Tax=Fictibacillus aquaticus TaxID=2021314 RepID=A0A235FES8_9BACL|nr:ABC transporter permease [Fictibacillus aquaticus]OYD59275.1 ABC transporter permease [Fictibacillus aquaticus]
MRIRALVIRIIRQFARDKRTLAMMIAAPMLILSLMSFVFSDNDLVPVIGINEGSAFEKSLSSQDAETVEFSSKKEAVAAAEKQEIDGYVTRLEDGRLEVMLEGSDPKANGAVLAAIQKAAAAEMPAKQPEPAVTMLHGDKDMEMFDSIGPFLIGFFIFFFVFLIAGVSFLRERTNGTLERLLATPLKRWEIVAGYVLGFGIFTVLQSAIIVWYAIEVLDIMMAGSIIPVIVTALMLAVTALTLGTLLSAFAKNELQMIQFIPIVIVPQVFFSGLFSLETMAPWVQKLGVAMPLTYGGTAIREVMIRGGGIADIASELLVLLAFSVLFMILNTFALKKHRKL